MAVPSFAVREIGNGCYALDDQGRTVALVTGQGYIDWLLRSPVTEGPSIDTVGRETHLSYVRGLKLQLCMPEITEPNMTGIVWETADNGTTSTVTGDAVSANGRLVSRTSATIALNDDTHLYEWSLVTTLRNVGDQPVDLPWIEYNNIYPGDCGRCMLFAPEKKYHCTLLTDSGGKVWEFPHQHILHYGAKIAAMQFGEGTLGGFFGEQNVSPVCVLHESSLSPDWRICDMYFDLHCGARTAQPLAPGEELRWRYTVKYLTPPEVRPLIQSAELVPVTDQDREQNLCPRFELGPNHFDSPVQVDHMDDASGFRPRPPVCVWDREVGDSFRGSLRLLNDKKAETVWSATPPSQIPADSRLTVTASVKTHRVTGKGIYLRLRYHTFSWHPEPHVEWVETIVSEAVSGTTDGWEAVAMPTLLVPPEHVDYLVWFDVVLEGRGTAWVTDVDVNLVRGSDVEGEDE